MVRSRRLQVRQALSWRGPWWRMQWDRTFGIQPGLPVRERQLLRTELRLPSRRVSGVQQVPLIVPAGGNSGDMAGDYNTISGALKYQLNDQWAWASSSTNHRRGCGLSQWRLCLRLGAGSQATIDALGVTVLAHYRFNDRMSVYGGIKAESVEGTVSLFSGYRMSTDRAIDYGFVVGAAYEIPDIALRVALTYSSAIDHTSP